MVPVRRLPLWRLLSKLGEAGVWEEVRHKKLPWSAAGLGMAVAEWSNCDGEALGFRAGRMGVPERSHRVNDRQESTRGPGRSGMAKRELEEEPGGDRAGGRRMGVTRAQGCEQGTIPSGQRDMRCFSHSAAPQSAIDWHLAKKLSLTPLRRSNSIAGAPDIVVMTRYPSPAVTTDRDPHLYPPGANHTSAILYPFRQMH